MRKGDLTIAFKAIALTELPNGHKRVAAAILDHYNRATGRCDPSMESLSLLLQINIRSVVRAINRLVRENYYKRDRHGGHFYCNQYTPVWETYRAIDAHWARQRTMHRSRFDRTQLSLPSCQTSPLGGDFDVTQTNPNNNHSYETYSAGHPSAGIDRTRKQSCAIALSTIGSITKPAQGPVARLHVKHSNPGEAARNAAERRWNTDLSLQYSRNAELYGRIVEAIDRPLSGVATDAEIKFRGGGIQHIFAELRNRDLLLLQDQVEQGDGDQLEQRNADR